MIPFFSSWLQRRRANREMAILQEVEKRLGFMQIEMKETEQRYRRERVQAEETYLQEKAALQAKHREDLQKQEDELEKARELHAMSTNLSTVFKPFETVRPHTQSEQIAIAHMSLTLLEALSLLAADLERGMSNDAMKMVGDDHYRKLWMAFGVHTLMDGIKAKRTAYTALNLREEAAKKVKVKEVQQQVEIRTMKHIYDKAPL